MSFIKKIVIIVVGFSIFLSGCISPNGIVTGIDGKPIQVSPDEVYKKKCALSRAKSLSDLHDQIEGVAIFEGVVISKQTSSSGKVKAELEVSWLLHGVEAKKVVIESSENSPYGINFDIGKKYRIAAYKENGVLKTWSWMGTYKIENKPVCE